MQMFDFVVGMAVGLVIAGGTYHLFIVPSVVQWAVREALRAEMAARQRRDGGRS